MYNDQTENRAEQPVQTAPNSNVPTEPPLFTQPDVLHFINCRKWARFVSAFAPELRAANLTVPDPGSSRCVRLRPGSQIRSQQSLCSMDDRPWREVNKGGKPSTKAGLAIAWPTSESRQPLCGWATSVSVPANSPTSPNYLPPCCRLNPRKRLVPNRNNPVFLSVTCSTTP